MKQNNIYFCIIIILFIIFCIYCSFILNKSNNQEGFSYIADNFILDNFRTINGQPANKSIIANEIINGINNHEKIFNIYNDDKCDPLILNIDGKPDKASKTNNTCPDYASCMPSQTQHCAVNDPLAYFTIYTNNDRELMANSNDPPKSYLVFALNILPYLVSHDNKIKNFSDRYKPYPGLSDIQDLMYMIYNNSDQSREHPGTEVYVLWYLVDYLRYQDYYINEYILQVKSKEIINLYKTK